MSFESRRYLSSRRVGVAVAATLILGACPIGCGTTPVHEETMPSRDINAVMEAHTQELMSIPGVTGVAIGETEDHTPCILVLIREDTAEIQSKLPKELEGHPVRTLVTGEIVPMQGDE